MNNLTLEQKATNSETMRHILTVQKVINYMVTELLKRGNEHDDSKLKSPEVEAFTEYTSKLRETTYDSPEYNEYKKKMGDALAHHYANNSHHAEHYKNGINDMSLIDLVEMFCDWKAATLRHNDGNLLRSIEINAKRFNIPPMLVNIFENTAKLVDHIKE